jgi:hypothetical protein
VRALGRVDFISPFALALAFVLETFGGTHSTLYELWRPLVAGQLLAGLTFGVLWVVIRERHWAAILASILLGLIAGYTAPALFIAGVLAWWCLVALLRRIRRKPQLSIADMPTRVANVFASALVLIALVPAIGALIPHVDSRAGLAVSDDTSAGPDIYVLLLDGYPRADTLLDEFGIDNSAFLQALTSRGFDVSERSAANYMKTWLTVGSMLDGQYLNDVPALAEPPDGAPKQILLLHEVIESSAVVDALRQHSYDVTTIPSPVTTSDYLGGTIRSTGHLTALEIQIIAHSLLGRVLPEPIVTFLAADQRENLFDQLSALGDVAAEHSEHPRLVLTHLMAPHLPFILDQEPDYLNECFPRCDLWTTPLERLDMTEEEFVQRLSIQIPALNEAVLAAIDEVTAADPDAIVIVMSDHGIRHHLANSEEHFRNLFAARVPDHPDLFAADIAPVNVFRRILSGVFGEDLEDLPYHAWVSDWIEPLTLTRYK